MGKKIKNPKLLKPQVGKNESMLSVFNKFANKVTQSHKKKIEKVGDTKQRLMQAKKTNKMLKVSKRTSKFALIDDEPLTQGMTHKGKNINELQEFNDMNFGSDGEDDQFLKAHQNLNFTGFDQEEENKEKNDPDRPKSKAEVYKEIIEKSRLHKHLRQEVYEQNLEKAVELDNQFPDLVSKLKFRNRDSNVKDKLSHVDHEFDKLANELKEDERVVSNKVIEKSQKYTDTLKRKKNQQLNSLMKDSDSEDVRDWAKNANEDSEDISGEEDEIDDVQLSSGEEDSEEEEEEEGEQLEDENNEDESENQELEGSQDEPDSEEDNYSSKSEEEEAQEAEPEPTKVLKHNRKIVKPQPRLRNNKRR